MAIHAKQALLPGGWAENVRLTTAAGRIVTVESQVAARPGDHSAEILVPGMPNLHSHAFQRGFSGLTERRGSGPDSFWTWRDMMYRFALSLTPDQMQAIAAMAFVEMLEAGYTRLGEFHYLHHAPDGRPYSDPAEMSGRIFVAARDTGIALTHLPVFYAHGGFGPTPAGEGQRRFLHSYDAFARLVEQCETLRREQDRVGIAPHSLRAASMAEIRQLAADFPDRPFHIHIAEQVKEVEDCLGFCGARPVEYLLDQAPVDPSWCLIHATHLTSAETRAIAASGAVVGLCPLTEANLGDGIFPGSDYLTSGGAWGIGTDSNVEITVAGELKQLEYSQRLASRARNVMTAGGSVGAALFAAAVKGGAQALSAAEPQIAPGADADLVALTDPLGPGFATEQIMDRWIFGRDLRVADVWAFGVHVVQGGEHILRGPVAAAYASALRAVLA